MKRIFYTCLGIILLFSLLLTSCAKETPTQSTAAEKPTASTPAPTLQPKYGGTLKMVLDFTPAPTLGWPPDYSGPATRVSQLCVESLLRSDFKGNTYPWLAESYTLAEDLKSVTLKLRKNVKFHDGTDFTAQAVKWNLDNQMAAKKAPYWTSVEIVDEYTIRINFSEWKNALIFELSDTSEGLGYMVSPTAFQKNGIDWMRQNPIGTGPFKFISFNKDVGFKTVKNQDYWIKGKPYLDGVEMTIIVDPSTRAAFVKAGGVDVVNTNTSKLAADLADMGFILKLTTNGTWNLMPDTNNPDSPWAKQKVREAAEYAIDREGIAKGLGWGFWQAPYQIPARGSAIYESDFSLSRKYNPERAKQLLAEAGYPDGFKTYINCYSAGLNKDAATAVQSYFIKVGLQAELDFPELAKYATYQKSGWQNGVLFAPLLTYGNFNEGIINYGPVSPLYPSWQRPPDFTSAFNASLISKTPDVKLIRLVTDTITKNALIIPIHETGGGYAVASYVMNMGWGERGMSAFLNWEDTWLNK